MERFAAASTSGDVQISRARIQRLERQPSHTGKLRETSPPAVLFLPRLAVWRPHSTHPLRLREPIVDWDCLEGAAEFAVFVLLQSRSSCRIASRVETATSADA
jgi:hypothetical protein